jgi:hypothetical protein
MAQLRVKPSETRDILAKIDSALYEGPEGRLRRALESSVFPLIEDGNGPGYFMDGEGDYYDAHLRDEAGMLDGECYELDCLSGHLHNPGCGDSFAAAIWDMNFAFQAGRNDKFYRKDLGLDYEIVNESETLEDDWGDRDPPE